MSGSRATRRSLTAGLRTFVRLADDGSTSWIVLAVLGSIVLAAADTAGVAAMLPLMQLFTGDADLDTGVLGALSDILGTDDVATLVGFMAASIALLFIVKSVCTIPFRWWLVGRTARIAGDAASELLRRYLRSSYQAHRTRNLAEVYRTVGDSTYQGSNVLQGTLSLATDVLMLGATLVVLFVASPLATLLALALFGLLVGGVQRLLRPRQRRVGEELAEASAQGWMFLRPALDGFRDVRLARNEESFVAGYRAARRRSARAQRSLALVSELPKYLLEVGFVVLIALLAVVLFAIGDSASALATMGVFAAAAMRMLPTLNRVTATFAIIRSGEVGLGMVCDAVEELDDEPAGAVSSGTGASFGGDIVVSDVSFRYADASQDLLSGIDLEIGDGSTVAFVGPSGAGKSTLLDLMLGLIPPTRGRITSGGTDIRDDPAGWFAQLGVVPQDVFLLNDTVAANVAFGPPDVPVDEGRIRRALELAELADVVDSLPDGLATMMGERGVRLSGGQRQRIGLARALYRRPRILVLDEATSALDTETEHQIANTLDRLRGTMTVVIVAHRLSTVRRADVVHFMVDGRITASGGFEQLRSGDQGFARLVELGELR